MNLRPALRRALTVSLGASILSALVVFGAVAYARQGSLVDTARFARPDDSLVVLDRHGMPLRFARVDGADRRWVPLSEHSPSLVAAVLAAEDKNFYHHRGVEPRAILRSAARDLLPWTRLSGASTLTQQLVKLVYGRRPGVVSKALEALRAISLEQRFSKDEILEQYLNRLPFGDGIVGVERASEAYFGHAASTLRPAESALLAGIPQAPNATEPRRHLARALARRDLILARMSANGSLSETDLARALAEHPAIVALPARPYFAPRFVDAVLEGYRRGVIRRESNTLTTSLDLEVQRETESLLSLQLDRFTSRGARNASAIVVRTRDGEVLAYVGAVRTPGPLGGADLDLLRARRQPGSTLKPFVYQLLFERGGTSATVLDDVASPMLGAQGSSFTARDYDGRERGPVRARVALASSLNLAALDAARQVGPEAIVHRLRTLGFHIPQEGDRYGAAVVLGGADVNALELARAYATLARGGLSLPLSMVPVTENCRACRRLSPAGVAVTRDILRDPEARRQGFGRDLLDITHGAPFLLKTGTSTGWRDAWAAVATDHFTVVVWIGDPSGAPMREVSGFEASAPVALRILAAAERRESLTLARDPSVDSILPGFVSHEVCPWSGLRPGPRCPHTLPERFVEGSIPVATCSGHDPHGDYLLPARFHPWAERTHASGISLGLQSPAGAIPVVIHPHDGARFLIDASAAPVLDLRARVGDSLSARVRWELDGAPLSLARWTVTLGHHRLVALHGDARSAPAEVDVDAARGP